MPSSENARARACVPAGGASEGGGELPAAFRVHALHAISSYSRDRTGYRCARHALKIKKVLTTTHFQSTFGRRRVSRVQMHASSALDQISHGRCAGLHAV